MPPRTAEAEVDPDDVCVLAYTSGTTSDPKGVLHTHRTLLAEMQQITGMSAIDGIGNATLPFYFLLIAMAALVTRRPRAVWAATGLTVAGCLWLVFWSRCAYPEYEVSGPHCFGFGACLILLGILLHLLVRSPTEPFAVSRGEEAGVASRDA